MFREQVRGGGTASTIYINCSENFGETLLSLDDVAVLAFLVFRTRQLNRAEQNPLRTVANGGESHR